MNLYYSDLIFSKTNKSKTTVGLHSDPRWRALSMSKPVICFRLFCGVVLCGSQIPIMYEKTKSGICQLTALPIWVGVVIIVKAVVAICCDKAAQCSEVCSLFDKCIFFYINWACCSCAYFLGCRRVLVYMWRDERSLPRSGPMPHLPPHVNPFI